MIVCKQSICFEERERKQVGQLSLVRFSTLPSANTRQTYLILAFFIFHPQYFGILLTVHTIFELFHPHHENIGILKKADL
ncbi:hypothetical protein MANES_03G037516v8 [Manihot esculenta]|uniref:Uncharacterized protein n=1 Tax=Manihot esculenta TaxID=3983 RepID=A0ACB7HXR0_MANES|nr:hypothetical protein MANES_03G037516v8 [Manihot esculenta]